MSIEKPQAGVRVTREWSSSVYQRVSSFGIVLGGFTRYATLRGCELTGERNSCGPQVGKLGESDQGGTTERDLKTKLFL